MKAQYSSQPAEAVIKVKDGTAYIVLCQNIVEKEEPVYDEMDGEATGSITVWECDEHQIVCQADALDLSDVQANPGKYMDYEPSGKPDPVEERFKEIEDALIELAEIITEA